MVRILLRFPEKIVDQPIISQVVLQYNVQLNILAAHVNSHGGEVLVEIPAREEARRAVKAFKERGVIVAFPKLVDVDEEKCLHCGSCYSLCPVGAINIKDDFSISFDREKCLGSSCGQCIDACPARAITLTREIGLMELENENRNPN